MPDMTSVLIDALLRDLGNALAAMTSEPVRVMPAVGSSRADWRVSVQITGSAVGAVSFGISHDAATALVGIVLGSPSLVEPSDITDTLRELVNQAAGSYVNGDGKGMTIDVAMPERASVAVPDDARRYDVLCGTAAPVRVAGWGQVVPVGAEAVATPMGAPVASAPAVAPVSTPGAPRNLDVLLDIDLPITVRFGETAMTLENLARLSPGAMIDLERSPDEPVDLLVNGHLVARGQVVVVSSCYGLRVTEVVSPADRLRSLQM